MLHNIAGTLNDEVDDVTADDPLGRPYREVVQLPPRRLLDTVRVRRDGADLDQGRQKRLEYVSELLNGKNLVQCGSLL